MDDEAIDRLLDVPHLDERTVGRADPPVVGKLPAGLGVERGAVEDQLDLVAGARGLDELTVVDEPPDAGLGDHLVVAGELDLSTELVRQLAVDGHVAVRHLLRLGVGLGAVALLGHEPPEPGLVDVEALLGRHLEGEVDREAVGVVQLERLGAAERARARWTWLGQPRRRGSSCRGPSVRWNASSSA